VQKLTEPEKESNHNQHECKQQEKKGLKPLEQLTEIPTHVYFLVLLAILMTSTASILIRFAGRDAPLFNIQPAQASTIAFWRLVFATVGMFFGAVVGKKLNQFIKIDFKKDIPFIVFAGAALAGHFITWNLSLEMTNVVSSITIVYLMPLFSLLFSVIFLKENVTWVQFGSMLLTIGGAVLVGLIDWMDQGLGNLYGDLFALAGAITGAAYYVIGRQQRKKLGIFGYMTFVYAFCTLFLLIYNLALGIPLIAGISWQHYLLFLGLAIGPSCLGHTLYNYSLGFVKVPVITIAGLGEMFGATLLAFIIFQETPHWVAILGMFIVAIGIAVTVILENRALSKKNAILAQKNNGQEKKEEK
jgi:drug/metabolite transporter (DMT)-like permease